MAICLSSTPALNVSPAGVGEMLLGIEFSRALTPGLGTVGGA